MRVYVAGPVSGRSAANRPAFDALAARVRAAGYDPVVPHDYVAPGWPRGRVMRVLFRIVTECDGIAVLPDWRDSSGAWDEVAVARQCGLVDVFGEAWPGEEGLVAACAALPDPCPP